MIIKKLEVAGLRAFEYAEFEFHPGMNLLVGVNGVGKTTVLDALRVCLSKVLPEITASRSQKLGFTTNDIRIGFDSLQVKCDFAHDEKDFNLIIQDKKQKYVQKKPGVVREQTMDTPDIEKITPDLSILYPDSKKSRIQPLSLYFSTRRSLVTEQKPSAVSIKGGQIAAFAEAFSINRDFNIREAADWMMVQKTLGQESDKALFHLSALLFAAEQFLPEFGNLHVIRESDINFLMIEKKERLLNISQLSDGERGMLCLALDLARRLSLANPDLENPVLDGTAIVLIDELDLHLHPQWQRTIVDRLTSTFPNCQFIATTHSPQIIPSVEPEQVLLIKDNKVIRPDRTLGMDTNWILKNIMETDDSPKKALEAIEKVENLLSEGDFEAAREEIASYIQSGLDRPEWAIFEARMARFETFGEEE